MAINRAELVSRAAKNSGLAQSHLNASFEAVMTEIAASLEAGEKVTIPGWFSAERTERAARTGRNPQTGEAIQIPAGHGVKLSAGSKLKAAVGKK